MDGQVFGVSPKWMPVMQCFSKLINPQKSMHSTLRDLFPCKPTPEK